jgi:predicted O-linked N-acetylglucosamine transferase (SPINDLY family)
MTESETETQSAIEQAVQTALEHHQAGRLAEAEGLYRQVLDRCPDHADALHLLGVLAGQTGRTEASIALIGRAIALNPGAAAYHGNLAETYRRSGQWEQSIASYRRVLELNPGDAQAHHKLGTVLKAQGRLDEAGAALKWAAQLDPDDVEVQSNLGITLCEQDRLDEAIAAFARAVQCRPDLAEVHNNLGTALRLASRLDEAITAYERAITLRPDYPEARNNLGMTRNDLGNALWRQGRFDEALDCFSRAVALTPGLAAAQNNLGSARMHQGHLDKAIVAYGRAIALQPDFAEFHSNLGFALYKAGRLEEAVAAFGRAIALEPGLAEAYNNLGNALWDQGCLAAALAAFRQAVTVRPELADGHNNLAIALRQQGQPDAALAAFRQAIALDADYAEAHNNLGVLLKDQGHLDEALDCFHRAVALKPDYSQAASNVVFTLWFHPDFEAPTILAAHRDWARRFAEPLATEILPHGNDRAPDRRLRVGFLSPDFRVHPVGQLLVPLFAHHDRRQTEFIGYSDVTAADGVTRQLKALAEGWHETAAWNDRQVADRIRADRIDILVDTTMHTASGRPLVFARKPAPVQVAMLSLPVTTGLAAVDYRLTDSALDPPGCGDDLYAEQSIRLPHGFWCYPAPAEAPPFNALPAETNGFVSFGCLNQLAKVSPPAWDAWLAILQALPAARLLIYSEPGSHLDAVRARFHGGGITGDRLGFVGRVPQRPYFARYHELDLSLDPFPFSGHASTLDSLWMGVPVITLAGRTVVGRAGVSILSSLGLSELIAETPQQYVEIAVALARDQARLSALRAGLRGRMERSALMDVPQFAAEVDAVLRQMWKTWCGSREG